MDAPSAPPTQAPPLQAHVADGLAGAIGNTPLIRLRRASEATGCEILGKAEFMQPGGSVKDRAGLGIIEDAERRGQLVPGEPGIVVEGTAGNTGIGLTLVANARGYRSIIVVPHTQSREKLDFLRMIGADLRLVDPKPLRDPGHYVNTSRRIAEELAAKGERVIWANQFGNLANAAIHEATTGPEIWAQTAGRVDAFTCACGTGGTLTGVARALKARNPKLRIVLADPMGSGMYSWIKTGEVKAEGNSITEGIGQASAVPGNLEHGRDSIDDALQVTDPEALEQIFELQQHEGISVGGSAGINVAAAIKLARQMGPGHTIVTILCDGGARYQSKIFNPEFLRERGLPVPPWLA
ncbi:cysteine synthase A [Roseicella frigidaeris]|uniref:Cysteine synthase A n=1 Tax=Roseicella frigidaeris TaxID=2230885 RepID=A0A327LYY9_9PROT|nr:cysteine synthase A [Roseicella frigidaeris]RAI55205.1 cysteine synthase A [Roseicella frigidaeris]